MKEIKTFTIAEVIKWLKLKRNKGKTFKYYNEPSCMFTKFVRYQMKEPYAICHAMGKVYKQGYLRIQIAKIPFHSTFWDNVRFHSTVTTARMPSCISICATNVRFHSTVTTARAIKILTSMAIKQQELMEW